MKRIILFALISAFLSCKGQTEDKSNNTNKIPSFGFLSEEVLKTKTKEELRLIRNEIFARKGYVFKSEDLNTYFKAKTWYTPNATIKVTLTDEEQSYIDKIKNIENANKKTSKCIEYYNDNVKKVYPLIGSENWDFGDFFDSYNEENSIRFSPQNLKQGFSCDGYYVYNIDCYVNVENVLFTAYCNEDPIFHIVSIKGDKVIKAVKVVGSSLGNSNDSITGGYHDIDFILDRDYLEVYKIFKIWDQENSTEENMYPVKEVRRELISKYKLTDNGIVEL